MVADVAVVATENDSDAYIAAAKDTGYGHANLVMTLVRKGEVFPTFFRKLFAQMKRGVSMPVALEILIPPIPGVKHTDVPDAIFDCEAGQIAFR